MVSPTVDRRYGVVGSVAFKAPVAAASTGNLTLSGAQTVGSVALTTQRVLVKDQTDTTENGVYTADSGAWTRALDFNSNYDIVNGSLVYVTAGTSATKGLWAASLTNPVTIGTDAIAFVSVLATT